MARMLVVLLWSSAAVVGAVRQVRQVEESPFDEPIAPDLGYNWRCPDECLGCCQAHVKGTWVGKHTNDRFKCWLESNSSLPPGCDDAEAEVQERNDAPGFKVTCPFGDGLTGERARERRTLLRKECATSMSTRCCCLNPNAKENKIDPTDSLECLPDGGGSPKTVTHLSRKTGKEHRFIREDPQTRPNTGACVNASLVPVEYEQWVGGKKVLGTHGRCCLKAEEKTTREKRGTRTTYVAGRTAGVGRFRTGQGNQRVTRFRPGGTTHRAATYAFVTRVHCVAFETLWRCVGPDRGLTPSGVLYKRVPNGQCITSGGGGGSFVGRYHCPDDRDECACSGCGRM